MKYIEENGELNEINQWMKKQKGENKEGWKTPECRKRLRVQKVHYKQ